MRSPPPPPARVEARPAPPVADATWVSGRWEYRDGRYYWVRGYYIQPRPGYVYQEGYWRRSGDGYVWVEPRWQRVHPSRPTVVRPTESRAYRDD